MRPQNILECSDVAFMNNPILLKGSLVEVKGTESD